jgi:hypothetical protein
MSFNTTVSGILTANGLLIPSGSVSLPAGSVTAASVSGLAAIATTGAASNLSGLLATSNIPNLNASNINSGNFSVGTFGTSVVPSATGTYDLGSSTSNWRTLNCSNVTAIKYTGNTSSTTGADLLVLANTSTSGNTTKFAGLKFQGTDTVGSLKDAAIIRSIPADQDYVSSGLSLWTRLNDSLSERVRITSAGWIGIGQSTPTAMLHVTGGSAQFDSNVTVASALSTSNLTATGTVSLPAGSVAASAVSSLDASKITTGIFGVGSFGANNILTTGTLGAGASTLGALTCTTITTGNNNITAGTGTVTSAQHNPTTSATYDLGASATAWRSAFLSSNLTVGGAITGSNGLTITGPITLQGQYVCSLPATFDTVANGVKDLATFTCTSTTSGQISFDISLVLSQAGTSSTKRYLVSTGYNITTGSWQRCIPISVYASTVATDNYELQMQSTASPAAIKFRLVHTVNAIASTPTVNIIATYAQNDVPTFANLTGNVQYTDASWATYGFLSSTTLTQVGGQVGVGTLAPSAKFHVSGGSAQFDSNVTVTSALSTSNLTATGTVTLPSGSVTSANISSVDASKITTGIFGVGSFGANNILTTGTLGAGASTVGALTCTTISTGNNNITAGTGTVTSAQHNPTTSATYDLGAPATAWRSAFLSSNLSVGGAITGSNGLTITGTVSLPSGAITSANISGVDASKITTGIFGVGAFGTNNISTTGSLACAGQSTNSFTTKFDATTANACRDVVQYAGSTGGASFLVTLVQSASSQTCTKEYTLAAGYNLTNGAWQRCIPRSAYNGNSDACELQINSSVSTTKFRLVHSVVNQASTPTVTIHAFYNQSDVPTITSLVANTQYIDSTWTTLAFASSTALTQVGGQVGVGTIAPSAKFHVSGGSAQFDSNVTVTSALSTSNLTATGTVTLPSGSVTSANISGVDASKITTGIFGVGSFGANNILTTGTLGAGASTVGALSATTAVLGQSSSLWARRTFSIAGGPLYSTPTWWKIATFTQNLYCSGCLTITGLLGNVASPMNFTANIGFHTLAPSWYASLTLDSADGSSDYFASGVFDIALYIDSNKSLFVYVKQNASYLTMSLDVTTCQFEGNGHTIYPSTSYALAYAATNTQLMAADTSLTSVLSSSSFYTLCGSNIRRTKGSASTFGSITTTNGLTVSGGTVSFPNSSIAAAATTGTFAASQIPNLNASNITAGTFGVGSFGTNNILTTGTLGAGAISCTSIGVSGGLTTGAGQGVSMPGVVTINDSTNSGASRGIHYWSSGDANWKGYMCASGANKSGASGSACTSLDGRTSYHIRNRAFNGSTTGFLWENSAETGLMSLIGDTGVLYVKGGLNVVAGGTVSLPANSVGVAAISGLASVATSGSAADLSAGVLATARIPNLNASNLNAGTFTVGGFGTTNIFTTGTLDAGASTLGALTCTTITTGNNNITAGTGTVTSAQHNPTTNATYDLGASATAWRSAFLSSNLTVGGAITGSNGLTITGPMTLQGQYVCSVPTTFDTVANGVKDLATFTCTSTTSGQISFDISLVLSQAGTSLTKRYLVSTGYNITTGSWQRCIPISVHTSSSTTDSYELQMQSTAVPATIKFRLVHSVNTIASTPTVNIKAAYAQNDVPTFANLTGNTQYTDANWATYGFVSSTALTQVGGQVGVGTLAPSAKFHVSGGSAQFDSNVTVTSALSTSNLTATGTVTLPSGSVAGTAIASLDAAKINTGTFTVGAFGSANIATTGTLNCSTTTVNAGNNVNTVLSVGASGNTAGGSTTQINMYGTGSAETRLYAWSDGASYLQHNGLFAVCSINSTTPQLSVSSAGHTTVANNLTVSDSTTCTGTITGGSFSGLPRKYWSAKKQGVNIGGSGYYPVATFDSGYATANIGSTVRMCGTIGGYLFYQQATVDLTFAVRDGVTVMGSAIGYVSAAQAIADIVLFQDTAGASSYFTLYINAPGYFLNWDLSVESGQIGVTLNEPAAGASTPSGSQILSGLLSAPRVTELSSGTAVTSLNNRSIYTYSATLVNNVNWTTAGTVNTGSLKCGAVTSGNVLCGTIGTQGNTISAGTISCTGVNPGTTNTSDLGTSSLLWRNGYFAGNMLVTGTIGTSTARTGNTWVNVVNTGAINANGNTCDFGTVTPTTAGTSGYNLGSAALPWTNLYKSTNQYNTSNCGMTANSTTTFTAAAPYHMFANANTDDNTLILGSTTTGSGLVFDDIVNAEWKMTTGGYNLNFYQQSSGTASQYTTSFFTRRVYFSNTGQIYAQNTAIAAISSDERVKTNIRPITGALDRICGMTGRIFDYKYPQAHNGDKNVTGFIAQEIEEDFPELSCSGEAQCPEEAELCPDGVKSYGIGTAFHANVVEAFKELRGQKDEEIQVLKDLVASLAARIAALENA